MSEEQLSISSWVERAAQTKLSKNDDAQAKRVKVTLVVFQVGREQYGVPISLVKEVVEVPHITPLPQTPDYLLGACNVRGTVFAIVDAERRIQDIASDATSGCVIILNDPELKVGFLVKNVPNTVIIDESQINRSANVLKALDENDQFINGIVKHNDKMIFMIDLKQVI